MALFLGRFDNKLDRKGRVSVPAPWRTALAQQSFLGVVAFPSPTSAAIEGCDIERMERLAESIDQLNPFAQDADVLNGMIMTRSHQLAFDGDGRIVLPEDLVTHAGLDGIAMFAGKGRTFQIWNPDRYADWARQAETAARETAQSLVLADRPDGSR